MKLIYTSQDRFMVWDVKNSLKIAGYHCHIRNEYAQGGAGDIAPIETWPEVWLDNDEQFESAMNYLNSNILKPETSERDWLCGNCGEINGASFDFCWHCGIENKAEKSDD